MSTDEGSQSSTPSALIRKFKTLLNSVRNDSSEKRYHGFAHEETASVWLRLAVKIDHQSMVTHSVGTTGWVPNGEIEEYGDKHAHTYTYCSRSFISMNV